MSLFLDQADVISEEGSMNARYYALIDLTAHLFIALGLQLEDFETSLSISRQWVVLNQSIRSNLYDTIHDGRWDRDAMRVVRNRWILRAQKRLSSPELELDELSTISKQFPPLEIVTKELQQGLEELESTPVQVLVLKFHGYMDLGEYFFNQKEYQHADKIFARAQEISLSSLLSVSASDESSSLSWQVKRMKGFRKAYQAIQSPNKINQVKEL